MVLIRCPAYRQAVHFSAPACHTSGRRTKSDHVQTASSYVCTHHRIVRSTISRYSVTASATCAPRAMCHAALSPAISTHGPAAHMDRPRPLHTHWGVHDGIHSYWRLSWPRALSHVPSKPTVAYGGGGAGAVPVRHIGHCPRSRHRKHSSSMPGMPRQQALPECCRVLRWPSNSQN